MANARQSQRSIALATQQILQTSMDVLWNGTNSECEGLGANATLQRELDVSPYVADHIIAALEHLELLSRTGRRGMGAYYYVPPRQPTISVRTAQRVLREVGTAPVLLRAV